MANNSKFLFNASSFILRNKGHCAFKVLRKICAQQLKKNVWFTSYSNGHSFHKTFLCIEIKIGLVNFHIKYSIKTNIGLTKKNVRKI